MLVFAYVLQVTYTSVVPQLLKRHSAVNYAESDAFTHIQTHKSAHTHTT